MLLSTHFPALSAIKRTVIDYYRVCVRWMKTKSRIYYGLNWSWNFGCVLQKKRNGCESSSPQNFGFGLVSYFVLVMNYCCESDRKSSYESGYNLGLWYAPGQMDHRYYESDQVVSERYRCGLGDSNVPGDRESWALREQFVHRSGGDPFVRYFRNDFVHLNWMNYLYWYECVVWSYEYALA